MIFRHMATNSSVNSSSPTPVNKGIPIITGAPALFFSVVLPVTTIRSAPVMFGTSVILCGEMLFAIFSFLRISWIF